MRVSTLEQNLGRQEFLAKENNAEKIFEEKASGKNTDRPEFKKMMEFCREGDVIYVESISRIARNTLDLLNIVKRLEEKNVGFVSLKEAIDTTTPQGRFILTIFGALFELEREQTLQRQREGIALAKLEGKYKGRQPIKIDWSDFERLNNYWKKGEITAVTAMSQLGLKPNTFYRRVKTFEERRKIANA